MRKMLFIFFIVMVIMITGCAVKETVNKETQVPENTADAVADAATSASISEADDIVNIEDIEADAELEDAGNSLIDW
jgi:hypothetical protein